MESKVMTSNKKRALFIDRDGTIVVEPLVDETLKEVGILGFSLEEAAERNYERWDILGKKQLFEPWKVYRLGDYDDQVEYLLEWMDHRKIWLGAYFQKSDC